MEGYQLDDEASINTLLVGEFRFFHFLKKQSHFDNIDWLKK